MEEATSCGWSALTPTINQASSRRSSCTVSKMSADIQPPSGLTAERRTRWSQRYRDSCPVDTYTAHHRAMTTMWPVLSSACLWCTEDRHPGSWLRSCTQRLLAIRTVSMSPSLHCLNVRGNQTWRLWVHFPCFLMHTCTYLYIFDNWCV